MHSMNYPPLNVEVLGNDSAFIRVHPVSTAVTDTLASEVVQILGYEWIFYAQRSSGGEYIHLLICAPEFYDEYHCSKGARRIGVKLKVESVEQDDETKIQHSILAEMTPADNFKTRGTGIICNLIRAADVASIKDDIIDLTVTIELLSPINALPLSLKCASDPAPDFTLTFLDGKTLHVHKLVLQLASTVFANLLTDLPTSTSLHMKEDSSIMHLLLSFIYPVNPKPTLTLRTSYLVCKLADKYDVAGAVAPHICVIFRTSYSFSAEPESLAYVMAWLQLADSLMMTEMVDLCLQFLWKCAPHLAWGEKADVDALETLSSSTLTKLLVKSRMCPCLRDY